MSDPPYYDRGRTDIFVCSSLYITMYDIASSINFLFRNQIKNLTMSERSPLKARGDKIYSGSSREGLNG